MGKFKESVIQSPQQACVNKDHYGEIEQDIMDKAEWYGLRTLVDDFSVEMKKRFKQKFDEGLEGWDDVNQEHLLRNNFIKCIDKMNSENITQEDYIDIVNYMAIFWNLKRIKAKDKENEQIHTLE